MVSLHWVVNEHGLLTQTSSTSSPLPGFNISLFPHRPPKRSYYLRHPGISTPAVTGEVECLTGSSNVWQAHIVFVSWCFLRHGTSSNAVCLWYGLLFWGRDPNKFKRNVQNQPNCVPSLIAAFHSLLCGFALRCEDMLPVSFTFPPGRLDWVILGTERQGIERGTSFVSPLLQVCFLLSTKFLFGYISGGVNEEICNSIHFANL